MTDNRFIYGYSDRRTVKEMEADQQSGSVDQKSGKVQMTTEEDKIDSTDDRRVDNNPPATDKVALSEPDPMRIRYRVLSELEKATMGEVKSDFHKLWMKLHSIGQSRELSLAKTSLEDSCMWAVKHITGDK